MTSGPPPAHTLRRIRMAERQLSFTANEVAHLVNRANVCFREGAFSKAIRVLERALRLDAGSPASRRVEVCDFLGGSRGRACDTITGRTSGPNTGAAVGALSAVRRPPEDWSDAHAGIDIRDTSVRVLRGYRNLLGAHTEREDATCVLRIGAANKGLGNSQCLEPGGASGTHRIRRRSGPSWRLLGLVMRAIFRACCSEASSSNRFDPARAA